MRSKKKKKGFVIYGHISFSCFKMELNRLQTSGASLGEQQSSDSCYRAWTRQAQPGRKRCYL